MEEENYDKIISECSKEIEAQGKYMAEALLLRATFYLLIGSANAAKPDLDKVISLKDANVKVQLKVCVHGKLESEHGFSTAAMLCLGISLAVLGKAIGYFEESASINICVVNMKQYYLCPGKKTDIFLYSIYYC